MLHNQQLPNSELDLENFIKNEMPQYFNNSLNFDNDTLFSDSDNKNNFKKHHSQGICSGNSDFSYKSTNSIEFLSQLKLSKSSKELFQVTENQLKDFNLKNNNFNKGEFCDFHDYSDKHFLWEFKKSETAINPLDLLNSDSANLVELIKNVNGSRLLQKTLTLSNKSFLGQTYEKISEHLPELMIDSYGNYFCQQFYKFLPKDLRINFLMKIMPSILPIAKSEYGNYALQFLIDNFKSQEEIKLMIYPFSSKNLLSNAIYDNNSIHVVEKLVTSFPEDYIPFIYNYVLNKYILLCFNKSALNLVKKVIKNSSNNITKMRIISLTFSNFYEIIQHSYANNSIQCILEVRYINKFLKLFIF